MPRCWRNDVINLAGGSEAGQIIRITPAGKVLEGARQHADEILECSPISVCIALDWMGETESIPDELEAARLRPPALDDLIISEDAMEGPLSFAQKRKPQWKNR